MGCEDRHVQAIGSGCVSPRVAELPVVHVPTFYTVMEDIAQNIPININIQSASVGASMASQAMVSSSSEPVTGRTMGASHQTGSPLSAERACLASFSFGFGRWIQVIVSGL